MADNGWRSLPLKALRAFEAAARHQSFARAAAELDVTPAAISQHIKVLEQRIGLDLFRRHPQGITITDNARDLLPAIQSSFATIGKALEDAQARRDAPVVIINSVGVFARGWLMQRLAEFKNEQPGTFVQLYTHNNRNIGDLPQADLYVRFGRGDWPGFEALQLTGADVTPMCAPAIARSMSSPEQLIEHDLLSTYHSDEWQGWFEMIGIDQPPIISATFDSSAVMVSAAIDGLGIAIAAPSLFQSDLESGRIACPFDQLLPVANRYFLTRRVDASRSQAADRLWNWLGNRAERGGDH